METIENEKVINSSKQIIKSTSIVGGSQFAQILLGIIRAKFVAVILGTSGVGILGLYQAIIDLTRNITSCGINFSGVRDIAEAKSSNNKAIISRSVLILRRWAIGTGFIGMIVIIAFCIPISRYTFNDTKYAISIAFLSVTLFFTSISQAQCALLQGLQHVSLMAKANILGALIGSIVAILTYYFLGFDGIIPSLILGSIISLIVSWLYVNKIKIQKISLSVKESFFGGLKMAKFGFFIVANSLVTTIVMYVLKSFIAKKAGFDGVGLYQAVWTITNSYLGLLLNSMLADYFPRLSANAGNHKEINRLANEQYEITLLLGGPLMICLLSLSPIVISLLYSSSFIAAVSLLQWHIIGSFFVLISWPAGVIFLGKGKGEYSFYCEMISLTFYVLCIVIGWNSYGINILGVAYCLKAVINIIIVLLLTKTLTGFTISAKVLKIIGLAGFLMTIGIVNIIFNRDLVLIIVNCLICIISGLFTFYSLKNIIDFKNIMQRFYRK